MLNADLILTDAANPDGSSNGLVTITPLFALTLPSTITGTAANPQTADETTMKPFSAVITDPNTGSPTETGTVSGRVSNQRTSDQGIIRPFASVQIGDLNSGIPSEH